MSLTVEEGGEVRLECTVKGHPVPVISWVQNGESVEKDPHINANGKLNCRVTNNNNTVVILDKYIIEIF
jgi:hypothetical protein